MLDFFPQCAEIYSSTLEFARKLDKRYEPRSEPQFSRDVWKACAEFGLLGLGMPADYGGTGGDALTIVAAYEGFGYGCRDNGLAFSMSGQLLSCQIPLLHAGDEAQRRRWLPGLIAGDLIAAHASSEPDSGSDVSRVRTLARRVDGGYRVSGTKLYSSLAPVADIAVVLCRIEGVDGLTELLVPRESYVVGGALKKIGLASSPMGELVLDDVFVPAENVLGGEGNGLVGFMSTMEWERLAIMASSVGAMRRQLEACIAYARQRKQFGSPIGSFQAVSHRIVEMRRRVDTSRLMLYHAAYRKVQGRATLEASMAKLHISESRYENAVDAIRIFGAYGCMAESGVERELRDAVPGLIYAGTSDIQRNTIARILGVGARNLTMTIEPYAVVAIQSNIPTVRAREDYSEYIAYLALLAESAVSGTSLEHPVRLIVYPEAAFQGFRDEFTDMPHADYARDFAIDLPGRETQALGRIARRHKAFLVASAKARHSEFPGTFFNVAFILSPDGEIVHKYYKLQAWVKERSLTPHDVLSRWIELNGDGLQAFFPVARLPIGNVGTTICVEGSFPEIYRGLALNGAEILTRPSYPEPWVGQGIWEIQNRARAVDNTCYLIAPNQGSMMRNRHGKPVGGGNGGQSMIVDYRGRILTKADHASEGFVAAVVDVEGLRLQRQRAKFCNFVPYLRTELYRAIYQMPIWPADSVADHPPGLQAEAEERFDKVVAELTRRGAFSRRGDI